MCDHSVNLIFPGFLQPLVSTHPLTHFHKFTQNVCEKLKSNYWDAQVSAAEGLFHAALGQVNLNDSTFLEGFLLSNSNLCLSAAFLLSTVSVNGLILLFIPGLSTFNNHVYTPILVYKY